MKCIVNGEERTIADNTSVAALITELGLGDAVCAAEVDKQIVPHKERAGFVLKDGQRVEIVSLIGGG